jgi:hypothetical protein
MRSDDFEAPISRRVAALLLAASLVSAPARAGSPPVAGDETYALVLAIDGARGDLFKKHALGGLMPNVRRHFIDSGLWVEQATANFPTITGACMPSLLTGCLAGRHGLPSLYFFSREQGKYPVLYTALEAVDWDRWLSPDVKTLWEHFPGRRDALSFGPALHRGSDDHVSIFWNFRYRPMELRLIVKNAWRDLKQALLGRPPARLTVVYNGWFDHMEHGLGADTDAIREHYRSVDQFIGVAIDTFLRTIEHRRRANPGVRHTIVLASDHGHQEIREVVSIEREVRQERGVRILDKVWRHLFGQKIYGEMPASYADREVVLASGEGHALLYFPTPATDPATGRVTALDWKRKPPLGLLRRYPFRDRVVDVVAEAARSRAVAFLVGHDRETGLVHVYSARGEATIERQGARRAYKYRYRVVQGDDPLGFSTHASTSSLVDGGLHDGRAWQLATLATEYPDAVVQLAQAFENADRSPDLYLSAAPYVSIGDLVDGEKSRSKHGGLTKEEAWATLAFSGSDVPVGTVPTARIIDMAPTLLHRMRVPHDPSAMDGDVIERLALPGAASIASE